MGLGDRSPSPLDHGLSNKSAGHGPVTEICQVRTYRALRVSSARLLMRESMALVPCRGGTS